MARPTSLELVIEIRKATERGVVTWEIPATGGPPAGFYAVSNQWQLRYFGTGELVVVLGRGELILRDPGFDDSKLHDELVALEGLIRNQVLNEDVELEKLIDALKQDKKGRK